MQTTNKRLKAIEETTMISTRESESWIRAMCTTRMNGGRPEGYVAEIETKRIRSPIRTALTEVLGFAELELRPQGVKVLQHIGTEWWVQSNTARNYDDLRLNTRQHLAEASALIRQINAFNAPPRTEQQRMVEAFVQFNLPVPQYKEPSEDEREKEHGPPKRWSMGGRPRTTGNTRHPAIRGERTNKLKKLGSPIQFTARIWHKKTREKGPPSALTLIAHTTEIWAQLPFFKKGARNPSQQFNPSQDATQRLQLTYQQSPDHTENKGTQNGSAKMRNLTQESNWKWEQLQAADTTGEEGNIPL
ncbi:hypothetical protein BDD12DRAFT_884891 [Trichophaea hybrida]|nr:hypothetical protein BDD12DRAFT_884891 [Trichophaea hybrida]